MSKKVTNFGQKLKKYLDSGTIQVKTLSEITGLSLMGIYGIRDGKTDPKESTMRAIADALGYTLGDFIGEKNGAVHSLDDCLNVVNVAARRGSKSFKKT